MKWRTRGVAAMPYTGPLQLLVRRHGTYTSGGNGRSRFPFPIGTSP
jgi:hypothetical protein